VVLLLQLMLLLLLLLLLLVHALFQHLGGCRDELRPRRQNAEADAHMHCMPCMSWRTCGAAVPSAGALILLVVLLIEAGYRRGDIWVWMG
jgi:hypothetical protein